MIKFTEANHKYTSIDGTNQPWVSVTALIKKFTLPFDDIKMSEKSSKNKKSKWYGIPPVEIRKVWKNISNDAITRGNWYHKMMEEGLVNCKSIVQDNTILKIAKPIVEGNLKFAPDQKLEDNTIYPEHMVYLKSVGICGQSDKIEVINGKVNVLDFKTNRELTTFSYVNWEGKSEKMLAPLQHLDACHINTYGLQLSIYLYIVLRHSPYLEPGRLTINHIIFNSIGKDKYGYDIVELDTNRDPVVKEVVPYDIPYMKREVLAIIDYLKTQQK